MITLTWEIVGPLVASGLLIFLARINPELAARISAWAGSSPAERDLDISQIDYWAYQEAERFVRENPMQPTEGMSFGKPWAREVAPWEYADQGVLTVEELTEQFVVEGRRMRDPCKYLGERWGNVVWQERTPDRDKERRALEQAYEILCAPKFEKLLKMAELSDQVTNLLMKVDAAALGVILARLLVVDPDLGSRVGEAVRSGTLQDLDLTEMEFWKLRNVVEEAEVESQSTAGALTSSVASVVRLFGRG